VSGGSRIRDRLDHNQEVNRAKVEGLRRRPSPLKLRRDGSGSLWLPPPLPSELAI
jgi:hypothetical protein